MPTLQESKSTAEKGEVETKDEMLEKYKKKLPDWCVEPLTEIRAWKTLLRCMLAVFVTLILVVCQPSLNVLGPAAFFGLIVAFMIPPSMALSMFLIAALMIALGMCLGWAWGCAAMAAGLRARSQVLLASQVQTVQAGFTTDANIDAQYQTSIFRGEFLDPRSSAVIGVMFFFGTYAMGWLRAVKPRLTIAAVFATIVMDVMYSYAPLLPIAQYTLARQLLVPSACYFAVAITLTILIFPQSSSSIFLTSFTKTNLLPIINLLKMQEDVLQASPGDHEKWTELAEKARGLRMGHVAGLMGSQRQVGLLQLEVSRGRLGPGDLGRIFEKAKDLGARSYGLAAFAMLLDETNRSLSKINDDTQTHSSLRVRKGLQRENDTRHPNSTLEALLPILATSTSDLRSAALTSLQDASSWLDELNHSRWRVRNPTPASLRATNLSTLKSALSEFRTIKHFTLLEPFHDAFDTSGRLKPNFVKIMRASTGDTFRCHVFTSNLVSFSLSLVEFLEELERCERGCERNIFQWPTKFVEMARKAVDEKEVGGNPLDVGAVDEHGQGAREGSSETLVGDEEDEKSGEKKVKEKKKKTKKTYVKDPDAGDPSNAFQRFGSGASVVGKHLTSTNGVFALKYAIVSIALWIPQVCHHSAYFTYTNRGLWALIMAQTGLGIFAGEQITTFIIRFGATCLGLVVGMVMWYIGAGRGPGNPYGIVAVTVIGSAPILWARIHAPPTLIPFWLMSGVTAMLVVGYGWVDEHIYQTANQGSGASLAGRRALLVIIGFAAAFIMMLFPRPTTARRVVRLNIAKNLSETGDLYARIMTGLEEEAGDWATSEGMGSVEAEGAVEKKIVKARVERYRGGFVKILARIQTVQQQSVFAGYEPGVKGPWPKKTYKALMEAHLSLIGSLALLSGSYARLTPKWTKRLERSQLMQPAFIADCMALFTILHQSLSTAKAMPPTMLIFERLAYHEQRNRDREVKHDLKDHVGLGAGVGGRDGSGEIEVREDVAALKALGEPLSWDLIHDEQLSFFATAIVALSHVVNGLNEIQQLVISLVGESELGTKFDIAQDRWSKREIEV